MGLVHQQRHAAGVADAGDGAQVALYALVGRAGKDDAAHRRVRVQRGGHGGGGDAAVDPEPRQHRRDQVAGRKVAQFQRMVDGFMAVAGHKHLAAERGQRPDARQQPHGTAAHKVPAAGRAVEGRRARHRFGQDAAGVVQVVGAVDLGQVEGIAGKTGRRRHPAFVPRHVQRVPRPGQPFALVLQQ